MSNPYCNLDEQQGIYNYYGDTQGIEASIEASRIAVSDEVLINSNQMEKLLKYSPSTLQRLRKKGEIPCNKVGRRYYYPKNFFTQEFFNSIVKGEDLSKRFDDK